MSVQGILTLHCSFLFDDKRQAEAPIMSQRNTWMPVFHEYFPTQAILYCFVLSVLPKTLNLQLARQALPALLQMRLQGGGRSLVQDSS